MKSVFRTKMILPFVTLLIVLACSVFAPPRPVPTSAPPTATATPIPLSKTVTVVPQQFNETNQTPPFTLTAQTPQLTGSDDPRVAAINRRLSELVAKEVDAFRKSFQEITTPTVGNGSFLEAKYNLVSQINDLWSFKFDFDFYADGAAHPGSYSITLNYDLAQGKELTLADLFLPNADYLSAISQYCIAELSKQPFFDGPFSEGAQPKAENYRNWNIAPDGLLITFDEYQVAPYAAGPQQVSVPYSALKGLLNPAGPLGQFAK